MLLLCTNFLCMDKTIQEFGLPQKFIATLKQLP